MYDNFFLQIYTALVFILGFAIGTWGSFLVLAFVLKTTIKDLVKKLRDYGKELEEDIDNDN